MMSFITFYGDKIKKDERWMRHVARTRDIGNAYTYILTGKPKGKRALRKHCYRWKNNSEMDHQEIQYENDDWIHLAQDTVQWRTVLNTVMTDGEFLGQIIVYWAQRSGPKFHALLSSA
jgi:hypothetical protein